MSGPTYTSVDEMMADGWDKSPAVAFNGIAGPYYWKQDAQGWIVGLLTEERHSNGNLNIVHGGAMMTFADVALGSGAGRAVDGPQVTTIQLQHQFTASCKIGSFVSCRPEVVRKTSTLIFMRGLIYAGDRTLGSSEGIWRILDADRARAIKGG